MDTSTSRRLWSNASEEELRARFYRYPDKDYETWLGHFGYPIGSNYSYPHEFTSRVAAGVVSFQARMSLQTAFKYAKEVERKDRVPRFDRIFQNLTDNFYEFYYSYFMTHRPEMLDKHEGYIHAELFLWRCLSAFRASKILINRGYLAEPAAILRTALEQIAWCYAVSIASDSGQLLKRDPPKCISHLKSFCPETAQLYGILSNMSHLDFEAQKHYVAVDSDNYLGIMFQSTEFKMLGVLTYTLIISIYVSVTRAIVRIYSLDYDLKLQRAPNFKLMALMLFDGGSQPFKGDEIVDRLISARKKVAHPSYRNV